MEIRENGHMSEAKGRSVGLCRTSNLQNSAGFMLRIRVDSTQMLLSSNRRTYVRSEIQVFE